MKINVLLVDDHQIVRSGFKRMLDRTKDVTVVAEAENGIDAIEKFSAVKPDVTIMDISMPKMGGIEAIEHILRVMPKARIIVYSMHENISLIHRLYETGIKGYITKSEAPTVLVKAIRAVHSGGVFTLEKIAQQLVQHGVSGREHPADILTAREYEIFKMLAEGETNQTISVKLSLTLSTVNYHISLVKRKLGVSSSAEIARLAIRLGIIQA